MFYSSSTKGFYTNEIHGTNMPSDVVEITDDTHQALLEGQSQNKHIKTDADGLPILVDRPAPVDVPDTGVIPSQSTVSN